MDTIFFTHPNGQQDEVHAHFLLVDDIFDALQAMGATIDSVHYQDRDEDYCDYWYRR